MSDAPGRQSFLQSIDAIDHRAVDDKADGSQLAIVNALDEALRCHVLNVDRVRQARAIAVLNGRIGPFGGEEPPHRAVVQVDGRNAAQNVQRSASIGQRAVEALTLRVVEARRAVRKDIDAFGRFA